MKKPPRGSDNRRERAKDMMKQYASGGGVKEMPRGDDGEPDGMTPTPQKKATGGPVSGAMPKGRLDKPKRASGGEVEDSPKKKSSKMQVNIVISGKGDAPAAPAPMPMPPMPPAGGPPMPPPGMKPPGAFKRGGAIKEKAGAGSGLGRLEKAAAESKKSKKEED